MGGGAAPAMHPSSASADFTDTAILRLCFGRAVFICHALFLLDWGGTTAQAGKNKLFSRWLDIFAVWHIMKVAKGNWLESSFAHQKRTPSECESEGVLLGLLTLAVAVKPLADVVRNYIRCDSHEETVERRVHFAHPLPVARVGKGSDTSITQQQKERKPCRSGAKEKNRTSFLPLLTKAKKEAIIASRQTMEPGVCSP